MQQNAGCGCAGGRRRTHKKRHTKKRLYRKTHRGGGLIENALIASGALGLYSYFARKK